jgi:hypothetical protein
MKAMIEVLESRVLMSGTLLTAAQKLETDVKQAFADGVITPAEKVELVTDVQAVLTSAGIPASLAQQTAAALKAVVVSSNVTPNEVQAVFSDVTAFLAGFES